MNAVREFPPNPHALLIHVDVRMTDEIVETYRPGGSACPPPWLASVLRVPGVRVLSLNAYKIRLQKEKTASWEAVQQPVERLLCDGLGLDEIQTLVEKESPRRAFAWHGDPLERRVFEGRRQAADDRLAGALFAIHGVAELILDGNTVEVRKCPLRCWQELAPEIESLLVAPD